MPIRAVGFDSGGSPGVTQQAYAAWTRWRKSEKRVRLIGKISGRDAWTVLPTKGAKTLEAPKLIVNYPDTGRQANKVAARGAVPVAQFNPNSFKDDLMGQLQGPSRATGTCTSRTIFDRQRNRTYGSSS